MYKTRLTALAMGLILAFGAYGCGGESDEVDLQTVQEAEQSVGGKVLSEAERARIEDAAEAQGAADPQAPAE